MAKVFAVLRREYLQSVKTKMFWIGTLGLPAMMVLLAGLSAASQLVNPDTKKALAVMDQTGEIADRLVEAYQRFVSGQQRLMLAYRHPNEDDPPLRLERFERLASAVG